jgi:small-conductance mechanosensitive channel
MAAAADSIASGGAPVRLFGVPLAGVTAVNGHKLLLSAVVIVAAVLLNRAVRLLLRPAHARGRHPRVAFWAHQLLRLTFIAIAIAALVSIWFDNPSRLATALGLVTAGLAVALQRVVTAFAAYFVILRGRVFRVGDRIVMGGVRGDVIELGLIRTAIMEMGEPPPVQPDKPAIWVEARQYTGRIVTVTNDKIFDEPVYNYSRDFPYIWEELHLPVRYGDDRGRVEEILLEAARRHAVPAHEIGREALSALRDRYRLAPAELEPRVYYQLTDNWLALSLRFLTREHGVRAVKDAMSRDILAALDRAKIGIASSTYDIVGVPTIHVVQEPPGAGG